MAKEIADQGRICIGDKTAKSSSKVAVGDILTIKFGNKTLIVQVDALKDTTKKSESDQLYTIIDETYAQDFRIQ